MKIDSIEIQSYKTSFIQPFINSNQEYNYRSGWYLKISSEGYKGIGEIAPLENFSPDYNYLIEKKITKLIQISSDFNLDQMYKYISNELISFPSIQFGFETAIYDILSKAGSGRVLLRAAPSGTVIIAGGPIRAACEVLGIKDVVAKSLGSSNPINVLRACIKGFKNQSSPKLLANIRGKKIAEITKKKQ